jgi:hypothetical protein
MELAISALCYTFRSVILSNRQHKGEKEEKKKMSGQGGTSFFTGNGRLQLRPPPTP